MAKVVFIVGRSSNISIETEVHHENSQFNDIVQGNFLDSYYNLAYKSITAFNWLHYHCKGADIIMKVDDDIVLDVQKVLAAVSPYQNAQRHFMCYFYNHSIVIRDKESKFYVPVTEVSSKHYPPYCNGWVYIYTADIVEEMCEALEKTEKFKIEDIWTTGFVLKKLPNITRIHMPMLLKGENAALIHGVT